MSNKKIIDFSSGSISDSTQGYLGDISTGALTRTSYKAMKDYFNSAPTTSIAVDVTQTYTTGTTLTVSDGVNFVYINPSISQASLTITLPTSWHNSNNVYLIFGGLISSGNVVISSFSMVAGLGQTIVQALSPSGTILSGEVIQYHLNNSINYRII